MPQVFVDNSIIVLFIDSLCDVMKIEPQRIREDAAYRYTDAQTNVSFSIEKDGKGEKWVLHIPGGKSFLLFEAEIEKLKNGLNERENSLMLEKHKELYAGENAYKLYTDVQKSRKEYEMVEEAWQNLLTIYALNMDGDTNVS